MCPFIFEISFNYIISCVVLKPKYNFISFSDRDSHIIQLSGIKGEENTPGEKLVIESKPDNWNTIYQSQDVSL